MDPEKLKQALIRGLMIVEVIAKLTPNKWDDLAVAALRAIIGDADTLEKLADILKAKGVSLPRN